MKVLTPRLIELTELVRKYNKEMVDEIHAVQAACTHPIAETFVVQVNHSDVMLACNLCDLKFRKLFGA